MVFGSKRTGAGGTASTGNARRETADRAASIKRVIEDTEVVVLLFIWIVFIFLIILFQR